MRLARLAGLALLPAAALAQPVPGPRATPPPPIFGAGIEVINLNVSVVDADGRYVTALERKDFSVFEDGLKQELSLFTHEDLPISMVLMIDASASMESDGKIEAARAAAKRFLGSLEPRDRASVMQFNDRATTLADFTNERPKLEAAIEATQPSGSTSLHNALYVALKDLSRQKKTGELRRLAIVLLSDGEDTSSLVTDEQVLELARRTEIAIYTISLRGNRSLDRGSSAFSQALHLVTTLARDTGGQAFFPGSLSELDGVYDKVAEELRTQYNLGYIATNARRDGKWRRIVVRVAGRDDLQVRHRLGYFAPR